MNAKRIFLDTSYIIGLLNPRDQLHALARRWFYCLNQASEIWITEAVLLEIGNSMAAAYRTQAAQFIDRCYRYPKFKVVTVDSSLFQQALNLYQDRTDKTWGLTDCISFVVMTNNGLSDALTADNDFIQAGFRALLLEQPPQS